MGQEEWSKSFNKFKQSSKQELKFYENFNFHLFDKNLRILDVGCGRGDFVKLINKEGYDAVGIDISDLIFDKNLKDKLLVGDARNIPFKDNSFDLIVMNGVLHHLPKIEEITVCLREIKRVLDKNGLFCFCEPMNTLFRRFGNFMIFTPLSHLFEYSRYMRKIHEEEWPEYSRWLKNQDKMLELVKEEFEFINFKKDLLSMYIKARPL